MKKSLITLAVAGALAAPVAAMADATIYGAANVSFDAVNNGAVVASSSTNHVASNQSRIGFKGAEDLGGGTSAIWQIESQVNIDGTGSTCTTTPITALNVAVAPAVTAGSQATTTCTNANTLGTRNTFAGLSGADWGTVLLGRHDTPYKIATRGLDVFADTIADNRNIMGMTVVGVSEDARLTEVAAYISPAMSGFTVAVATVAGAETATSGTTKGGAWSLAGIYGAGPVNASLSYQVVDNGTTGTGTMGGIIVPQAAGAATSKATAWKLGGGYTMDALQLNAVYEKIGSSGAVANAADRAAWYLAGKYSVSASDAVKLAFTSAGKVNSVADTEANQFSVGYDHNLSKRTTVYALYTKLSNKTAQSYSFSSAATSAAGAAGGADSDPSAWSLGMKHSF